jgi:alpha-beta hydrolase superfamily lysophospholipase
VAIYLLGGIALYAGQDLILFRPVRMGSDQRYDFPMPHQDISIPVEAEDTLNLIRFEKTHTVTRGAVLYFHGNKRNISWYAKYIPFFTRHGYEVYMIDYPGYGKSTGELTEKKLYQWAALVYKLALKRFPADSLIIYGRSMGTGIAAQLASVRDCKRLILETPYYDFPSVVSDYLPVYPMNWLLRYQLPTHEFLDHVTVPVSIFHGTRDRVITFPHALRLAPHLKSGDEFIVVPGAHHNDLYKFSLTIRKLDSLLTLP